MSTPVYVLRVGHRYIASFMFSRYLYRPSLVLVSSKLDAMRFDEKDANYFGGYLSSRFKTLVVEQL